MATKHWIAADGVWSNAANWSPGRHSPRKGDVVDIDNVSATPYTSQVNLTLKINDIGAVASNATIEILAGDVLTVTNTVTNGGTINLDAGATFKPGTAIANSGLIQLTGAGTTRGVMVIGPAMALNGTGSVTLHDAVIKGASVSSMFANSSTISGAGWIGLNQMTLNNQAGGVVDAVVGNLVVGTSGTNLTNAGLMEASSAAYLVLAGDTINQSAGGTIEALSGGRATLTDDVVNGGTLTTAGTGKININASGGTLNGVTNLGLLQVVTGKSVTLNGAIDNVGRINTSGGATVSEIIVGAAGVTLSGHGLLNFNNSLNNIIVGASNADILTNVDNRITGAGFLGDGSMALINQSAGIIRNGDSRAMTIDTGANIITNAGLIAAAGSGGVTVASAVANTGTLQAANGVLTLEGAVTGTGVGVINHGTLIAEGSFNEQVTFTTPKTSELVLGQSATYTGTIKGFSTVSKLDLRDLSFIVGATATWKSGTLTVTSGASVETIKLAGPFSTDIFSVTNDGGGGSLISMAAPPVAPAASGASASLVSAMASFGPSSGAGHMGPGSMLTASHAMLLTRQA